MPSNPASCPDMRPGRRVTCRWPPRSDLVIPSAAGGSAEVRGLLKVLSSLWLIDQLASLPRCEPSHCGEHVADLRP